MTMTPPRPPPPLLSPQMPLPPSQSSPFIDERVFPVWHDTATDTRSTLPVIGRRESNFPEFRFIAYFDPPTNLAAIRFLLMVDMGAGKKKAMRPFVYTVPLPHLDRRSAMECITITESDMTHSPTASALKDAGFVTTAGLRRVTIFLQRPGFVWSRFTDNAVFQPRNNTARNLLVQLQSISTALRLSFYIKDSDRLAQELGVFASKLHLNNLKQWDLPLDGLRGLDWNKLQLDQHSREPHPPPQYSEVLVPETPPHLLGHGKTMLKDERAVSPPPPATNKRRRYGTGIDYESPFWTNPTTQGMGRTFLRLMMVVKHTLCSPCEYTAPYLKPYLRDVKVATFNADVDAFASALARLVVMYLFHSIHPRPQAQLDTEEDVAGDDTKAQPDPSTQVQDAATHVHDGTFTELDSSTQSAREEAAANDDLVGIENEEKRRPLRRKYQHDVFHLVTWIYSLNSIGVSMMWKFLCELGYAAREACDAEVPFEEALEHGEYGMAKARCMLRATML